MKKRFWVLAISGIFSFGSFGFAVDSIDTFKRAYDQWILELNSGLLGSSNLRRQEVAPFLLNYLDKVAKKEYTDLWCNATDIKNADAKYQSDLETLCGYGIFRGEKNRLLPKQYLTNAQAVTLIMRIVDGSQKEAISPKHWATPYFERAKALGYEGITPIYYKKNFPVTLENLINFLYSIEHPNESIKVTDYSSSTSSQTSSFSSSDDALLKLAEILKS